MPFILVWRISTRFTLNSKVLLNCPVNINSTCEITVFIPRSSYNLLFIKSFRVLWKMA